MREFLLFTSVIYGSLLAGWLLQRVVRQPVEKSRRIARAAMMSVETPMIIMVYWDVNLELLRSYFTVPLAALVVLSTSGVAGYLISRRVFQRDVSRGAFVVSCMFSNVGSTMGGFLSLLYLGDHGLVVSQLFLLFAIPFYFTVVFTVARHFAGGVRLRVLQAIRANFSDPLAALPLFAIVVGLALGLGGVGLPSFLALPRRVLVFASVILFGLSFGLTADFRLVVSRIRSYVAILPVKFIVAPLAGLLVVAAVGYTPASDPIGFKVILIQSMMPVAIWSVVAAKLFRLDDQLAFGLWIFTTIAVSPLVPVIAWIAAL